MLSLIFFQLSNSRLNIVYFLIIFSLISAKKFNRKEKKFIGISQPLPFFDYNKHMGGVDLHDNGIANYRIGKKWWWPLFTNLIDSVIVNAWKISNIANRQQLSQLDFRSNLAVTLMKIENEIHDRAASSSLQLTSTIITGRPSKTALPTELRFDHIGHIIIEEENKARRRCRQCKSTTIYMCKKCQVHLHPDCFEVFHTN